MALRLDHKAKSNHFISSLWRCIHFHILASMVLRHDLSNCQQAHCRGGWHCHHPMIRSRNTVTIHAVKHQNRAMESKHTFDIREIKYSLVNEWQKQSRALQKKRRKEAPPIDDTVSGSVTLIWLKGLPITHQVRPTEGRRSCKIRKRWQFKAMRG